jgi:hypothetical protein
LHVLATPPAFRLSQDQTLQLNFSDPARSSRPVWRCDPLTETDSFTAGVILETSLSHTRQVKTNLPGWLLPPNRLRNGGQLGLTCSPRQGSNTHLLGNYNQIDQGRSLCVHHRKSVSEVHSCASDTRPRRDTCRRRLGSSPAPRCTPARDRLHTLAATDYPLVKELNHSISRTYRPIDLLYYAA